MSLMKLGISATRLVHKNALLQRLSISQSKTILRLRNSKANNDDDEDVNKPIKFSTSEAASWDAVVSRTGVRLEDVPECQPYVVMASVAAFMIYFCILREENDIDQKLSMNLTDHFNEEKANIIIESQKVALEYQDKLQNNK